MLVIVVLCYLFTIPFNSTLNIGESSKRENLILNQSLNQSDYYLKNLIQSNSTFLSFWSLNELQNINHKINIHIVSKADELLGKRNIPNSQKELLKILADTTTFKKNNNRKLLKAFQVTYDANYLIAYLANIKDLHKRRLAFQQIHIASHNLTDYFRSYVNLLLGHKYNTNILINSTFHPSDLFIFNFIKDNKIVISACTNWSNYNSKITLKNNYKYITIIQGYYNTNNYNKIASILNNIDESLVPNTFYKFLFYRRISYTNFITGYYYKNLSLYRKILIPLSNWINSKEYILDIHLRYGNMLIRLGKIKEALKQYNYVYTYPKAAVILQNYSTVINNLAIAYFRSGDFTKYIQLQLRALHNAASQKNYSLQLFILKNLSFYYKDIGNSSSALSYAQKAINIANKHHLYDELAAVHVAVGDIYNVLQNNFDKSLKSYKDALQIVKKTKDYNSWEIAESGIALLYENHKKYIQSINVLKTIANRALKQDDKKTYLSSLIGIVNDYIYLKKYDQAEQIFSTIKNYDKKILDFDSLVRGTNAFVRILLHENKITLAQKELDEITKQILERARNSAEIQSGHLSLQRWDIEAFKLLTKIYINFHHYNKALVFIDSIKTINRSAYSNNTLLKSNLLSEKDLIKDQQLGNYIANLQYQLLGANPNQKISIQNSLSQAITEKKQLESSVLKNFDNKRINLLLLKNNIGYRNAILYFTKLGNQLYLAIITNDKTRFTTINFTTSQIDSIKSTIKNLDNGSANLVELHAIYAKLFKNIDLNRFNKLYVVPDGFLYELPLGILPVNKVESPYSYGSADYLIGSHAISYYTSLKDFQRTFDEPKNHYNINFAGFGISNFRSTSSTLSGNKILAPLPYTKIEVSRIDSLIPGNPSKKKLFLGKAATETAFRKWAPQARILHLATHSEVYYENPLFSVIYLNGDKNKSTRTMSNDGKIHAYELFEMNLANKMVMLSSCESGAGDYITGSGIIGLSRAFTYAGAQSLVLNLWTVNDHSAESISVKFYEYLKKGYPKAEALRKAKLYFINHHNANPYQWGSYIETGSDTPLYSAYPADFIVFVIILAFSMVTLSFIYFLPKRIKTNKPVY